MAHITVSALSHDGLLRDHNEDSLVIGPWTVCATVTESPQTLLFPLGSPCLVAVADGLGGHPGGEVASALVVRRLASIGTALADEEAVREAVLACNQEVFEAAEHAPHLIGMGTTLAGLVVTGTSVIVFNVGDSRVLDAGDGALRRLSTDDSPPPAPGQRTTNIVTQTLGGSVSPRTVEPHVTSHPLPATGGRYLVCSDGLTDPVTDEEIIRILAEPSDDRAAFELWRAAIEAGGPDNITLALVTVHLDD
ncbi:protein phosphatase 2C domain-containing protein [Kitasatospora sp. NPDC048540]|uniref:PP2C family protein-serine/threonine phosphatase n=1 Tax=unclassified Kitasatospora TaxID=2633591 RepID=UPI000539E88A|nr:protein phosphatase 2C domain-containing protein [Kitasatospora sp. MBT63]